MLVYLQRFAQKPDFLHTSPALNPAITPLLSLQTPSLKPSERFPVVIALICECLPQCISAIAALCPSWLCALVSLQLVSLLLNCARL